MTIHKSLFIGGAAAQHRSVLTRRQRIERLLKEGRWSDEDSAFGLPKVRTKFKALTRKQKKAAATAAAEVIQEGAPEGTALVPGAKPQAAAGARTPAAAAGKGVGAAPAKPGAPAAPAKSGAAAAAPGKGAPGAGKPAAPRKGVKGGK